MGWYNRKRKIQYLAQSLSTLNLFSVNSITLYFFEQPLCVRVGVVVFFIVDRLCSLHGTSRSLFSNSKVFIIQTVSEQIPSRQSYYLSQFPFYKDTGSSNFTNSRLILRDLIFISNSMLTYKYECPE